MTGRPEPLFPLFGALTQLDGVGAKTAQTMLDAGIAKPADLLLTLPVSGVDRRRRASIREVIAPCIVTVEVTVGQHMPPKIKGKPYRITVDDADTSFQLVFFHPRGDYLQKLLPTGQRRVVSGKLELFDGIAQIVHPDHVLPTAEAEAIPAFEPVYPLHHGITQKTMWKATRSALALLPELPEWIDPAQKARENWPDWVDALHLAHNPQSSTDLSPHHPARARLAYDELMAHQITLALARAKARRMKGVASVGTGALQACVLGSGVRSFHYRVRDWRTRF